jgi:hypothetical protein
MNYSDDPDSVRVDFFRPSGKWYVTEAVRMRAYFASQVSSGAREGPFALIHDALRLALVDHLRMETGALRHAGMWAVCIDPYHEHAHPLMIVVPERAP